MISTASPVSRAPAGPGAIDVFRPLSRILVAGAPYVALLLLALLPLAVFPAAASSQIRVVTDELLEEIFPGAERFGDKEGSPPVYRAYGTDEATGEEILLGFVFLTEDVPPEVDGYTAPIKSIVGMDLSGTLTGVRIMSYRESLRSNRGDFLRRPGVQGQFSGKTIFDAFRPRDDLRTVTGATISVRALGVGVRNAARRVAAAYVTGSEPDAGPVPRMSTITVAQLEEMFWAEMVQQGLVLELEGDEGRDEPLRVAAAYVRDQEVLEAFIGTARTDLIMERARERSPDGHLMFVGINGYQVVIFGTDRIGFVQDGDTLRTERADFITAGRRSTGLAGGIFGRYGLIVADPSIDIRRPFEVIVDLEDDRGYMSGTYLAFEPEPEPEPEPEAAIAAESEPGTGSGPEVVTDADSEAGAGPGSGVGAGSGTESGTAASGAPDGSAGGTGTAPSRPAFQNLSDVDLARLAFEGEDEVESGLSATLASVYWPRVISLLLLLGMATWAFVAKVGGLRWVVLLGSLGFLGFVDRGFLSVSHILAGISVGPSVYLEDLSLLILVAFTLVTTLLWGRVFCGYLCPFGVLQDILEQVVPKRFRHELPRTVHEKALWVKYGVLAVVLAPAVLGLSFTLYHWFEPFGTVFFWSPSWLLWGVALSILGVSAVVPRFYCRYMCPLGAALALGSLAAPFRIRRVEQCTICTVCERTCPTGAIEKERIDFKECVRCNECEIQLIEKNGVCRHDMEKIRPRLIQMSTPSSRAVAGEGAP